MADDDDKVVDLTEARQRLEPVRKEKAAKELRQQFQKAMGWNSWPKPNKNAGGKGPKPGGKGKGGGKGGGKGKKK